MRKVNGLTTRQLIAKLKKMNPDAVVVWQDHDQESHEYNHSVHYVDEGPSELCDAAGVPSVVVLR